MFGLDDAISAGLRVLDKFLPPDPAARALAEAELRQSLQQWDAQQNKINEVEAQSSSLFVAGWRPCVGWVCCAALSWTYILQPIAAFALAQFGYLTALPRLDMGEELMPILIGMLGLGGLRTFEKVRGVAAK